MSKIGKIAIVVALVAAVAAVVAVKQLAPRPAGDKSQPAQAEIGGAGGPAPGLPRLVDVGSTKCIPCQMMAPILEELKQEYAGRLRVDFIDVMENPDAWQQYGVSLIPTQIFLDASGKELFRHEGFFGKDDILAKWKELGFDFAAPK
ncbi:MAG: thioredoxin family protein [Planctomycetes bacterium]|nr:thioredoxin family protein [Planctomycetota bacterium]